MVSPASACPSPPSFNVPVLVNSIEGTAVRVCVSLSGSVTSGPLGGVPVAVAVLVKLPESMSIWVRV